MENVLQLINASTGVRVWYRNDVLTTHRLVPVWVPHDNRVIFGAGVLHQPHQFVCVGDHTHSDPLYLPVGPEREGGERAEPVHLLEVDPDAGLALELVAEVAEVAVPVLHRVRVVRARAHRELAFDRELEEVVREERDPVPAQRKLLRFDEVDVARVQTGSNRWGA